MTDHRDLKRIIRERQRKTGESYTASRAHVLRERAQRLGLGPDSAERIEPAGAEAVVLKVGRRSARLRLVGEDEIMFRSRDVVNIVPGHVVTLSFEKRWTWRDIPCASGRIEDARIDIAKLGLAALPLEGGELDDLRSGHEPFRGLDPYAPLWRELTAKPRASCEMDPIAWGAFPGSEPDEDPTGRAADLASAGDLDGARALLMDLLHADLRCLDAHAHLGNLEFDHDPARAALHYEIGVRIGELSLPPGFDGVLVWGRIWNRPFLRCLHGHGLCLWRLGRLEEARRVFERILSLNPSDNQGVRFCWQDVLRGRSWEEACASEDAAREERISALH